MSVTRDADLQGFSMLDQVFYNDQAGQKYSRLLVRLRDGGDGVAKLHQGVWVAPSLVEVPARLNSLAEDGYCFRGQTGQYFKRYAGSVLVEESRAEEIVVELDALIPSGLRESGFLSKNIREGMPPGLDYIRPVVQLILKEASHPWRPLLVEHMRALLQMSTPELVFRAGAATDSLSVGVGEAKVLEWLMVPPTLLKLVSLAQHYEFRSTMVDFTSDPDVALWFATHNWTGEQSESDRGYIYCIKKELANKVITEVFSRDAQGSYPRDGGFLSRLLNVGLWGVVDISDFDIRFGLRPRRQGGLSFFGLEASIINVLLRLSEAILTLEIPLDSEGEMTTGVDRAHLCPDEPLLASLGDENARQDWSPLNYEALRELCGRLSKEEEDKWQLLSQLKWI